MRRPFLVLGMLFLSYFANAWEINITQHMLFPGSTEYITLSKSNQSGEAISVLATLQLPGGKVLYLSPVSGNSGLVLTASEPAPITYSEHIHFTYKKDEWMPPGEYRIRLYAYNSSSSEPLASATFYVSSHAFPVTFESYDPQAYDCQFAKSGEDYWAVCSYGYSKGLFAFKISSEGRILIPPFLTKTEIPGYDRSSFSVVPEESGGFYILAKRYNPRTHKYELTLQKFTGSGHMLKREVVYTGGEFYYPWMVPMRDNRTVVLFIQNHRLKLLTPKGELLQLAQDRTEFYRIHFDRTANQIVVFYGTSDGTVHQLVLGQEEGQLVQVSNREFLTGSLSYPIYKSPSLLIRTDGGFYQFYPNTRLGNPMVVFFGDDGSCIRHLIGIENIYPYGKNAIWYALSGSHIDVLWREGDTHYKYARFSTSGKVEIRPSSLSIGHTRSPLYVMSSPMGTVLLFADGSSIKGVRLNYDYPKEPDLAVSPAEIMHYPGPVAHLGGTTTLRFRVSNRGEMPSDPAKVKVIYMGNTTTIDVPRLTPGASYNATVSLVQPEFLTKDPVFQIAVQSNDYHENNSIEGYVVFPPNTPVFPESSSMFRFQVLNEATGEPITYPHVRYTLNGVRTVSGRTADLKLISRGDNEGHISIPLPYGTHRLMVYHSGYPKRYIYVDVPDNMPTAVFLSPPGNLTLSFQEEGGTPLHPLESVDVSLVHQEDPYMADWSEYTYYAHGNSARVSLKQVMPGSYQVVARAFGYKEKRVTVSITGGTETVRQIMMEPLPRVSLSGRIVSSTGGVEGAVVKVSGLPYQTTTDSHGNFTLPDFPQANTSYTLQIEKEGFQSKLYSFNPAVSGGDLGEISLRHIYSNIYSMDKCRYAAWFQDASWEVENSYTINTVYGVWDMEGKVHYLQIEGTNYLDIDELDIKIKGLRWSYWGLQTDILMSIANWFVGGLGEGYETAEYLSQTWEAYDWATTPENYLSTYSSIADPLGTVKGGVVDCGDLDVLNDLSPPDPTDLSDVTVIRIDDVRIYDGDEEIFRLSSSGLIQYFSSDYPDDYMRIPVHLSHAVSSASNLKIYLYIMVENGEYSTAPLDVSGTDKLLLKFHVVKGKLKLEGMIASPYDYPGVEE